MSKPVRVGIYARVSTSDQTVENQLLDLRRYAKERGWSIQDEYADEGISGAKASRPALDRLMDGARKRKFDVLLVWRFDRFARSVRHLIVALEELRSLGIDFISYQENIDTSSALGQAIFTIVAAMAALERNVIIERVHAGLRRARQQGKHIGRPVMDIDPQRVLALRRSGESMREIAKELNTSQTKIFKVLHAAVTKPPPRPAP
jgi:DNA invertase Pin-like site-specific DNA recombinase